MPYTLIAHSSHPLGGFFLARLPDATFLAGQDEANARVYASPRHLYDSMYPLALNGHHWAWNLCYEIESFVAD
jgi:hypothetical protein